MKIDVQVPDGKSGEWEVSTFEVTEEAAKLENMRATFHPGCRFINPGTYKRLTRNGTVIMSNTQAEISDCIDFIFKAREGGDILINGLGLGVVLAGILDGLAMISVTVIEKSIDVINLVAPTFNDPRVTIIHANAFEWTPPKGNRYAAVWHDIWDNICVDNLPEMTFLHRKYGHRTGWQNSWCKELCLRYRG